MKRPKALIRYETGTRLCLFKISRRQRFLLFPKFISRKRLERLFIFFLNLFRLYCSIELPDWIGIYDFLTEWTAKYFKLCAVSFNLNIEKRIVFIESSKTNQFFFGKWNVYLSYCINFTFHRFSPIHTRMYHARECFLLVILIISKI